MSKDPFTTRFLLIDDDTDDRELFCEALAAVDSVIVCDQATDGQEAFSRLQNKQLSEPSIIFLDVNMPVMDGWQFLSKLKSEEGLRHIPVIMYSTSSNVKDKRTAGEMGALCFITKPHAFRVLQRVLGVVARHVHRGSVDDICTEVAALSAS
ncbi:MAG TPA: response regulator [Puia sp.]|uniref:response regulator n=1 Tax=Puia sp. TaxID=2045100 RepID=UPI002BF51B51|nr:response regulator [Puia sp.]HVU95419.1 response regulator [Puia sp.]